jgi:hypothetical protein
VERLRIGDRRTGNDWNKQRQIQGSFTSFRMTTWREGLLQGGEAEDRRQKNRQRYDWNRQRQIQGSFTTFRMTTWGRGFFNMEGCLV